MGHPEQQLVNVIQVWSLWAVEKLIPVIKSIFEQAIYSAETLSVLGAYTDVIEHFKLLVSFYLHEKFIWKSTTEKYSGSTVTAFQQLFWYQQSQERLSWTG